MKKRLFTTLTVILLSLLPVSQIEWKKEAAAGEPVLAEKSVSHNAPVLPNENAAIASSDSYMPKTNRSYTYAPSFEGTQAKTYIASPNPALSHSVELLEDGYSGYTYIEQEEGLTFGVAYSDVFFFSLSYPLQEKTTITDTQYHYDGSVSTVALFVESTSAAVTTNAGTFEHVAVLIYENGTKLYLAKDVGIIRITDPDGTITTELTAVD